MKVRFIHLLVLLPFLLLGQESDVDPKLDSLRSLMESSLYEEMIYYGNDLIQDWDKQDTLSSDYARTLLDMGRAFIQLEAFPEALKYNSRALSIFVRNRDSMGIARTYSNFSGVYFYMEDSAQAFNYLNLAQLHYPHDADLEDRSTLSYMYALLHMEFGRKKRALKVIDSLTNELAYGTNLRAYVLVASFELMDSTEYLVRYPNILTEVLSSIDNPSFRLTAIMEAMRAAARFGRLDILKKYWPEVARAYRILGTNTAISQKVDFSRLKAQYLSYEKDYKGALAAMSEHARFISEQDSLRGVRDVKKLETQINIKESALRAQRLEKELNESRQHGVILVLIIGAALIIIILIYRINRNTKDKNLVISEVANTRGKMISVLSHDIRTPLSQLQGLLEQSEQGTIGEEELKVLLPRINETTRSTTKLLDKIVNWINLNRGDYKTNLEEFSVGDLFHDIEDLVKGRLEDKRLVLVKDIEHEYLRTDRFLIQTALFNLLSNAIKFSKPGATIYLGSYLKSESQVLEVRDQGEGMSAPQLQKIRSEISTSSVGTQSEMGSGLGLAIVRDAVAKIKADFEIGSEESKGTICRITL